MPIGDYRLDASIAVSDIQKAVAFYEGKLGLPVLQPAPAPALPMAAASMVVVAARR